jgi:hypothetical protein
MEPHSRWDFKDALMEDRWRTVAARYDFFRLVFMMFSSFHRDLKHERV